MSSCEQNFTLSRVLYTFFIYLVFILHLPKDRRYNASAFSGVKNGKLIAIRSISVAINFH
jgi:hypothetical protein